jgi:hypothetical protein
MLFLCTVTFLFTLSIFANLLGLIKILIYVPSTHTKPSVEFIMTRTVQLFSIFKLLCII